jgi:NADH pyrophosphatase NudC (nudix superfamily)
MEIGSIFLILALLLLVSLFVGRPFLENQETLVKETPIEELEHDRSSLLAERDRLITALRELDFDYQLGKVPEEDYPNQRAFLMQQGVEVLRQLDTLQTSEENSFIDEQLEAAIAARRLHSQKAVLVGTGNGQNSSGLAAGSIVASPDDDLEVMLATRRRIRQDKSAGFCPKCGRPLQKSDHFCPKCGAKII